ncbi:MAG: glycosyltransferase family 2 protein [Bacteroidia bacterium]|nr:glycosyltransferase family 2 protein [Bacteroidia bacterium]
MIWWLFPTTWSQIVLSVVSAYLTIQISIAILIRRSDIPAASSPPSPLQVLIPFRNEAPYLRKLIHSLRTQTIRLIPIFGDDGSEDESVSVIHSAMHGEMPIIRKVPSTAHQLFPGKHAVLVFLEGEINSEIFFIADADMSFPPTWAEALRNALICDPGLGGVCAPSLPQAKTIWESFQRIEWASVLYLIAASRSIGWIPTAIGNSMAVKRAAWACVGGWKSLPPTLVEDYEMMRALQKAGWRFEWVFHPEVLGETRAEPSYERWIHQRLRWRQAVREVPPLSAGYWILQSLTPWMMITSGSWAALACIGAIWTAAELLPMWRFREVVKARKVLRYLPLLLAYRFIQGLWLLWLSMSKRPIYWRERWHMKERLSALR